MSKKVTYLCDLCNKELKSEYNVATIKISIRQGYYEASSRYSNDFSWEDHKLTHACFDCVDEKIKSRLTNPYFRIEGACKNLLVKLGIINKKGSRN